MPDTQEPEVVRILREYRAALIAREDAQVQRLAQSWLQIEHSLRDRMELLAREIIDAQREGRAITEQLIMRMDRFRSLNADLEKQITKWVNTTALQDIRAEQAAYSEAGFQAAVDAMGASFPAFSPQFDRLPASTLEQYIGHLGDGTPLQRLLVEAYPDSVDGVIKGLLAGVAEGIGPGAIAERMAREMGMGLERITLIARTEQLRMWRMATTQQYRDSGLPGVQKRLVTKDDRTCMACLMADGEIIPLDEELYDHPRGRCTSVFVIQVPGVPEPEWQRGPDWFLQQDEAVQRSMLGPQKFDLWKQGAFRLEDIGKVVHNDVWGSSPQVRTISELLALGRKGGAPDIPAWVNQTPLPVKPPFVPPTPSSTPVVLKPYEPPKISRLNRNGPLFNVGGVRYRTGGHYQQSLNKITMFNVKAYEKNTLDAMIAHEEVHARWYWLQQERERQLREIMQIGEQLGWSRRMEWPITAEGTLRKEWAKHYQVYGLFHETVEDPKFLAALIKDDGVTDYSRSYWRAIRAGNTADTYRAINETLAEIAKLDKLGLGGMSAVTPRWRKFYGEVINAVH